MIEQIEASDQVAGILYSLSLPADFPSAFVKFFSCSDSLASRVPVNSKAKWSTKYCRTKNVLPTRLRPNRAINSGTLESKVSCKILFSSSRPISFSIISILFAAKTGLEKLDMAADENTIGSQK